MSDFMLFGENLFGDHAEPAPRGPLCKRFVVPPFSVISAREGDWQERKRAWVSLGIKPESRTVTGKNCTTGKNSAMFKGVSGSPENGTDGGGVVSIFDPVLCELVYRWFSPDGGQVIDPFAGGSVRGIVATLLDRRYWGCDLRQEQIDSNVSQSSAICGENQPVYVCGDSMETLAEAPEADLIFSCPPYGDLEQYSDNPADLSSMEWHTFCAAYRRIIMRACAKLKQHRFACFVVGDFRDERGYYRNFVSQTITAFLEQGMNLYNEAILVTSAGSAPMRATRQFEAGRKLCKTHQNVLVFCKGDWRLAAEAVK